MRRILREIFSEKRRIPRTPQKRTQKAPGQCVHSAARSGIVGRRGKAKDPAGFRIPYEIGIMLRIYAPTIALLLGVCACAPLNHSARLDAQGGKAQRSAQKRPLWAAPPLERAISIRNGRTDEVLSFATFIDELAEADVVFLGETHVDETTHRVEFGVYEALLKKKGNQVVLAMEMFERDAQKSLDEYLAGKIDEESFLLRVREWGNYRTSFRPMVELAKKVGQPVIASNFPLYLRRKMARGGGPKVLEQLKGAAKRQAPSEFFANSPAYWRRVDNAVRGHLAMMRSARGDDPKRLYATQSLWDNSMGESCARALDEHKGKLVLHVNGGFHSSYWDGTVRQLKLRKPNAKIKTISISSVTHPAVVETEGKPVADYIVYAESRARDLNEGSYAVHVQREQEYLFHLPKKANDTNKVPLLIWLSDDGLKARDGLALWKKRLGADVAIAVLEAPYRERRTDLGEGGRWFWPDTFSEDMGLGITA